MIKYSRAELTLAMLQTVLLIVFFNVLMATVLPSFQLYSGRFSVSVMVVIFLSLFVRNLFLPFFILILLYIHSFFTIEPWAIAGLSALTLCALIGAVRHLLNFRSRVSIAPVTFLGYLLWYFILGLLLSFKTGEFNILVSYLVDGLWSGAILSLFSPFIFIFLDYIWKIKRSAMGVL